MSVRLWMCVHGCVCVCVCQRISEPDAYPCVHMNIMRALWLIYVTYNSTSVLGRCFDGVYLNNRLARQPPIIYKIAALPFSIFVRIPRILFEHCLSRIILLRYHASLPVWSILISRLAPSLVYSDITPRSLFGLFWYHVSLPVWSILISRVAPWLVYSDITPRSLFSLLRYQASLPV